MSSCCRVSDFSQGFGLGIWDGVSGLVTQPMKGAEEGGFLGGLIGFGKGLGGAVFKPVAGKHSSLLQYNKS
jgi:hypothetical protein